MGFLHPIIVHFPIALLTLYAVLEFIRIPKFMEAIHHFHVKVVLVTAGALGAIAAAITGIFAARAVVGASRILFFHEIFATFTLLFSVIISSAYLFAWFKHNAYAEFILKPKVVVILAILLLICVTLTGGLGGAMVYGTHFDPLMAPIFKLLGVY